MKVHISLEMFKVLTELCQCISLQTKVARYLMSVPVPTRVLSLGQDGKFTNTRLISTHRSRIKNCYLYQVL